MNPYAENALKYVINGYSVIPCEYGEKAIKIDWKEWQTRLPTSDEILKHSEKIHNIGLATGEVSNIIALDFDYDVENIHQAIMKNLPKTPCAKKGAKGITLFFSYNGEVNRTFKKSGQTVLEILSTGRQTVLPPSLHPNGMFYVWEGESLLSTPRSDIPRIETYQLEKIISLFEEKKVERFFSEPLKLKADEKEIVRALDFINPDCAYDEWCQVGMAICDFFEASAKGLAIFNDWSYKGNKYPSYKEIVKKYDSFKNSGITINTLFKSARINGYISEADESFNIPISDVDMNKMDKVISLSSSKSFDILNAPGIVGKIAKYINETSLYEQPILSLSAAITAAGTIYAQKLSTETDLRTNMYCLAVAETGSGKDHPRKAIIELFNRVDPYLEKKISGDPASEAGLLSALEDNRGVCLIQIDEFGHYLSNIKNSNGPKYLQAIASTLTKLYSSASTKFYGQQYSNKTQVKKPRVDIEQPCLNVLGSTVPDRLFNSITEEELMDGFLTRWLIFESEDYCPKLNLDRKNLRNYVPVELLKEIRDIRAKYSQGADPECIGMDIAIIPTIISETDEAKALIKKYYEDLWAQRKVAIENNDLMKNVLTRSWENMMKLALVANENGYITASSVKWAREVVEYNNSMFVKLIGSKLSSSKYEEDINDMYNNLKKISKSITKIEFSQRFRKYDSRKRMDLLQDLVNQGRVQIIKKDNKETIRAVV